MQFIYVLCSVAFLLSDYTSAFDFDLDVQIRDFGSNGTTEKVSIELNNGLQPRSTINIVSRTENHGTFSIYDEYDNVLLQVDNRMQKNYILLASSLNKKWLKYGIKVKPNPTKKGELTVTTIEFETNGYIIYVNGDRLGFYKHQIGNTPVRVLAFNNRVYKMVYLSPRQIIPLPSLPPVQ